MRDGERRQILPRAFELKMHDTDRYGRTVGELLDPKSRENVNLRMVREGQAAVYRNYCDDPRYPQAERYYTQARKVAKEAKQFRRRDIRKDACEVGRAEALD